MSAALRKLPDNFSETVIDDEIVVMQLETGVFFSLRDSARAIWERIDGTRDRAALLTGLAEHYDQTPDALAEETDAFLAQLSEAGLIAPLK